jgi:hypothetical protein
LEKCPANAYDIEEARPNFNDLSGDRAEARRLEIEISKFELDTGERLLSNTTRPQFEEMQARWETAEERIRDELLENPPIIPKVEINETWKGPKGQFEINAEGKLKRKKFPNRNRSGSGERGRSLKRGQRGRGGRQDDRSRSGSGSRHRYYFD